jgi:hypothetical protein
MQLSGQLSGFRSGAAVTRFGQTGKKSAAEIEKELRKALSDKRAGLDFTKPEFFRLEQTSPKGASTAEFKLSVHIWWLSTANNALAKLTEKEGSGAGHNEFYYQGAKVTLEVLPEQ